METPALLLFDLGGVLLENATFESLSRLLPEAANFVTIKDRWLASPTVRRFELGKMSADQFAEAFIDEWKIRLSPDAFLKEFASWPIGFYPRAAETLGSLRGRYRVGCLSNSNVVHWERFGGFNEHFDIALSSHQLGAIKPDDDAYLRALQRCGAAPSATWFFDDQPVNVETARRLGIRAYHVEGMTDLLRVLQSEGLLAG